jgi:hypothetical protein
VTTNPYDGGLEPITVYVTEELPPMTETVYDGTTPTLTSDPGPQDTLTVWEENEGPPITTTVWEDPVDEGPPITTTVWEDPVTPTWEPTFSPTSSSRGLGWPGGWGSSDSTSSSSRGFGWPGGWPGGWGSTDSTSSSSRGWGWPISSSSSSRGWPFGLGGLVPASTTTWPWGSASQPAMSSTESWDWGDPHSATSTPQSTEYVTVTEDWPTPEGPVVTVTETSPDGNLEPEVVTVTVDPTPQGTWVTIPPETISADGQEPITIAGSSVWWTEDYRK